MVGRRFAAVLVLVVGTIGFATASAMDVVTRGDQTIVLADGVTESTRPLSNGEHGRGGKRDEVNLTGQNCAPSCEGVAGTGPNQADCNRIIAVLNARNTATFTMEPYSIASWVHASCTIEFVQSTADTVTYTYLDLGSIATHLSDTCNAANGYGEGRCIFNGREDAIWVGNTAVSGQPT